MKKQAIIRQGMQIPLREKGELLGTNGHTADMLIAVCNALLNGQITSGGSNELQISDGRITFQFKRAGSDDTEEEAATVGLRRYRIKTIATDHLTCREWDGTSEGAIDFQIAKHPNARSSIAAETISGLVWAVSYPNANQRTLTYNAAVDRIMNQSLYTPYAVNGDVFAAEATGGTGVAAAPEWIEVLPLRRWEIDLLEFDVCVDGEDMKAMFPATQPYEP